MPGIVGIIEKEACPEVGLRFRQMFHAMAREAFYRSGSYINEQLGLWVGWTCQEGSFDDPAPQWNEDKTICIFFSGEDFTDAAEINKLRTKGHQFEPENASYLVHLYEELGLRFLKALNGRFSGLIVDLRETKIVLFNDRFGLERIYYHQVNGSFYFASEAKALLRACPELRKMDLVGLAETFSCGCVLQNRTLFAGVSLVPGGSIWQFRPGQDPTRKQYFSAGDWERQEILNASEYYERLKATWIRILPRYLRGKNQIAVSLTGGKDSRMIMAWSQSPPGSLPCFTFGGMFRDSQDILLARQIAKLCRQPHQIITLDGEFLKGFPRLAERTVYLTDGAMDVSGAAELYVNMLARQIAPIRLTGNYGQEILHRAIAFKPSPFNEELLDPEFARLAKTAERTYAQELAGNLLSFIAFKQVPWHHRSRLSLELSQVTLRSPYLDNELVALAFQRPPELAEDNKIQLRLIAEGNPAMTSIGTDRGILYSSIPLLTRANTLLKEFSFKADYAYDYGMPHSLARIDSFLKHLHLERYVLGRHKYYHYRIWYRDQLSGYIQEILLDPRTKKRPFLNGQRLEAMVSSHVRGTGNYTSEIHRVLTAELIHRQFID
jgi:asparagine synthase (glutamine-hydrolysing)